MNTNHNTGYWRQFIGKATEKWGRQAEEAWHVAKDKRDGPADKLQERVGKIRERYGIARGAADRQTAEAERTPEPDPDRKR